MRVVLPPENSGLGGQADREAFLHKSVEVPTEYRKLGECRQIRFVGDNNARVGNCCDLKSVLDDDEDNVSLVGPPRSANTDSVVNDNRCFVSALCGRVELDFWVLSGIIINQEGFLEFKWLFKSTTG